ENARLFFYYFGMAEIMRPSDGDVRGYLVPVDANSPALPETDQKEFRSRAMSITQVTRYASDMGIKHGFFALETSSSIGLAFPSAGSAIPPSTNLAGRGIQESIREFLLVGSGVQAADGMLAKLIDEAFAKSTGTSGYITGQDILSYVIGRLPQL